MNWNAIVGISEAIGAVGVIVSLLYLAKQIRVSARVSAFEAKLTSTRLYSDFFGSFIQSPELYELFLRGRKDLESLSIQDYYQFSNLSFQACSFFSAGYFAFRKGVLSDSDWFESLAILQFWLRGAGFRKWWRSVGKQMFGSEFVLFIESEMERPDTA